MGDEVGNVRVFTVHKGLAQEVFTRTLDGPVSRVELGGAAGEFRG